jgi:hypothetical protein
VTDFPDIAPARPAWLMTLADLALLLLGFMVLVHASAEPRRQEIARSLRETFGGEDAAPLMPVAGLTVRFERGSADLSDPAALVAWARAELRDPRVELTVTGSTDGSAADRDPATGSALLLATDRARAIAAALAFIGPDRLRLTTAAHPRGRAATVTLAFAGEPR